MPLIPVHRMIRNRYIERCVCLVDYCYCLPITTLASPYGPTPEDGYESGWTCQNVAWGYVDKSVHNFLTITGQTISVPIIKIKIATRYDRGEGYKDLLETVDTTYGSAKARFFNDTARETKIFY